MYLIALCSVIISYPLYHPHQTLSYPSFNSLSSLSPPQWLPLPLFLIFRILLFFYALSWLVLHIAARADTNGVRWLIFFSDLGYAILVLSTFLTALLTLVYTVIYYSRNKDRFAYSIPKKDFPVVRIYKQDNIAWYVKITWFFYIMANSIAMLVFIGYWGFLFGSCTDASSGNSSSVVNGTSGDGGGDTNSISSNEGSGVDNNNSTNCTPSELDVYTIHLHGVNVILVLLDLIFSRVPYQFFHLFYPSLFTLAYVIFTLIYWAIGGTNPDGNNYIYSSLDYSRTLTFGFAVALVFAPIVPHIILFLLAWLRDTIITHIGCCFRDVRKYPYRENLRDEKDPDELEASEEVTKM